MIWTCAAPHGGSRQHPDRLMRPDRPRDHTIWTLLHDLHGSTLWVTRLRAWSGATGWRFESSSAREKALHSGAFALSLDECRTARPARGNFFGKSAGAARSTGPRSQLGATGSPRVYGGR